MQAKRLVLDLLRVAHPRSVPVSSFVETGKLFDLRGNAVRVAVTRLLGKGLLESDERGSYRLADAAAPVSRHVEGWRLGESRVRRWDGGWLTVWLPKGAGRTDRRRSRRALGMLGFAEGLDSLWVRPDNLAQPPRATVEKLAQLGLEAGAQAFVSRAHDTRLVERWKRELWPTRSLATSYVKALADLERSKNRVHALSPEEAAAETFVLGGAAIRILATDPLLPRELLPVEDRARLSESMREYDVIGRGVWSKLADVATFTGGVSQRSEMAS